MKSESSTIIQFDNFNNPDSICSFFFVFEKLQWLEMCSEFGAEFMTSSFLATQAILSLNVLNIKAYVCI